MLVCNICSLAQALYHVGNNRESCYFVNELNLFLGLAWCVSEVGSVSAVWIG